MSDAQATPLFAAKGLTRRFHGLIAVNDVTFAVKRGEILGLIGPNGAGKTTLISLISGTLMADAGDVLFEGQRINHLKPFQRAHLGIGRWRRPHDSRPLYLRHEPARQHPVGHRRQRL